MRTLGPNQGLLEGRVLSSGPVKGLTILVNFQDVTSTVTRADVNDMLNGTNYTRNGNICSAREYFQTVSSGKLDYTNVVVGPYTLSRNRQFYVNTLLIEEALNLAVADGLDLKQFDSRNENVIDALNVLYAGQTQYNGELWPHNYHIDLRFGNMQDRPLSVDQPGTNGGGFEHRHVLSRERPPALPFPRHVRLRPARRRQHRQRGHRRRTA